MDKRYYRCNTPQQLSDRMQAAGNYDDALQLAGDGLMAACERVLRSGHFILGTEVERFEQEAAIFLGAKHAIAIALELAHVLGRDVEEHA
jgi:hypothetical protein